MSSGTESLDEYQRRDGEGIALAEAELAIVLSDQQVWTMLTKPDVLAWRPPA